jgi:hypothetical protein
MKDGESRSEKLRSSRSLHKKDNWDFAIFENERSQTQAFRVPKRAPSIARDGFGRDMQAILVQVSEFLLLASCYEVSSVK